MARAVARSQAAFHALDPKGTGKTRELRETVARVLPEVPFDEARAMVLDWWETDHAQLQEATA